MNKGSLQSRDIAADSKAVSSNLRNLFYAVFYAVLAVIPVVFCLALLPHNVIKSLIKESGVIETAQLLLYIACAIISWIYAKKGVWKSGISGGMLFMVFVFRELDFQKRFTIMSVTKTRFFISPEVSLTAKLITGTVLISIIILLILFVLKTHAKLLDGLRAGGKWAFLTCSGIILLVISVALESVKRELKGLGIAHGESIFLIFKVFEEMIELAIPILFLMALLQWRKAVLNRNLNEKRL